MNLASAGSLPSWLQQPGLARSKRGPKSFTWVSQIGGRDLGAWVITSGIMGQAEIKPGHIGGASLANGA